MLVSYGSFLISPYFASLQLTFSLIQVISNLSATTGPLFYMESWGRFPKERDRLFQLIADSKVIITDTLLTLCIPNSAELLLIPINNFCIGASYFIC